MNVGIVADTHMPFVHPNYLRFCKDMFRKYKVDQVVFIGDVVDHHAISFHEHDCDGFTSGAELDAAREVMQKWHKAFKDAKVCLGNHDVRAMRMARKVGLSCQYLRDYADIFETPTWEWDWSFRIDGVLYEHGTGASGKNAALNLAIQKRQSVVIGHVHSFAGVSFHANETSRIFGMNVGAGIDIGAYAFDYGRNFPVRPVLGCGIVLNGIEPFFIPMPIGDNERYSRLNEQ